MSVQHEERLSARLTPAERRAARRHATLSAVCGCVSEVMLDSSAEDRIGLEGVQPADGAAAAHRAAAEACGTRGTGSGAGSGVGPHGRSARGRFGNAGRLATGRGGDVRCVSTS